jgi:archaetidylinositol phosphate synthase
MLDLYKEKFRKLERIVGKIFSLFPFSPNQYTLVSLIFGLGVFYFLVKQNLILGILFFLIASFLDFIDGAVARYKNISTKIGAYLDTISDRYVEGILLFGMLFLPLPKILLPAYAWIFLILFGSILTTYTKAAATEKGLVTQELKGGLLSRGERIILLLIALILGNFNFYWMTELLIPIAILTNLTVIQRIYSALTLWNEYDKKRK